MTSTKLALIISLAVMAICHEEVQVELEVDTSAIKDGIEAANKYLKIYQDARRPLIKLYEVLGPEAQLQAEKRFKMLQLNNDQKRLGKPALPQSEEAENNGEESKLIKFKESVAECENEITAHNTVLKNLLKPDGDKAKETNGEKFVQKLVDAQAKILEEIKRYGSIQRLEELAIMIDHDVWLDKVIESLDIEVGKLKIGSFLPNNRFIYVKRNKDQIATTEPISSIQHNSVVRFNTKNACAVFLGVQLTNHQLERYSVETVTGVAKRVNDEDFIRPVKFLLDDEIKFKGNQLNDKINLTDSQLDDKINLTVNQFEPKTFAFTQSATNSLIELHKKANRDPDSENHQGMNHVTICNVYLLGEDRMYVELANGKHPTHVIHPEIPEPEPKSQSKPKPKSQPKPKPESQQRRII